MIYRSLGFDLRAGAGIRKVGRIRMAGITRSHIHCRMVHVPGSESIGDIGSGMALDTITSHRNVGGDIGNRLDRRYPDESFACAVTACACRRADCGVIHRRIGECR